MVFHVKEEWTMPETPPPMKLIEPIMSIKDSFDESDGVYLVLELAPEGELFNWIVMKQKLTESETRNVFLQLFQGLKYLVLHSLMHLLVLSYF